MLGICRLSNKLVSIRRNEKYQRKRKRKRKNSLTTVAVFIYLDHLNDFAELAKGTAVVEGYSIIHSYTRTYKWHFAVYKSRWRSRGLLNSTKSYKDRARVILHRSVEHGTQSNRGMVIARLRAENAN